MQQDYKVWRDKATGSVTVKIKDNAISKQKADSLARGMFVPEAQVRFSHSFTRAHGTVTVRKYLAQNWL